LVIGVGLAFVLGYGHGARAEEFSIVDQSTVVGRNTGYPTGTPLQGATPVGKTDLVVETAFFFKTLELFDVDHVLGETFTGSRIPIRLRYRPRPDLTVELGAMLGHDFGDDDRLNIAAPLVRLAYEPAADVFVLGGTLLPTHWIHDAILDDVQKFRTDVEHGFQLRTDRPWLKNDTWLNWRVREQGVRAEEFEIGLSNQLRLWHDVLWLDTQFMWAHAGGQISESDRVEQNLVYLGGISVGTAQPLGLAWLEQLRAGAWYCYSRDETNSSRLVEGYGRDYLLSADLRMLPHVLLRPFAGVFRGDDFIATRGDPLYFLDEYSQLGGNLLFSLAGGDLGVEAGFVKQWTDGVDNLSYQLCFVWGQAFSAGWLQPQSVR